MEGEKKNSSWVMSLVAVLVLAVLGYGAFKYTKKDDTASLDQNNNNPVTETPTVPDTMVATFKYRDGTYTMDGDYVSPGGAEKINVTLVLKDDVVVDATVKGLATLPASKNWQSTFISGVKVQVVGKKLDEVTLTKVSGSSLTPKGWNDAVAKIQVQAKA